jgi:hypothetical protein
LARIPGQFFKTNIQGARGMLFAKRKTSCCPFLPSLTRHFKVSDPRWKKAARFHFFSLVFSESVGEMDHGMHDATAIPQKMEKECAREHVGEDLCHENMMRSMIDPAFAFAPVGKECIETQPQVTEKFFPAYVLAAEP